MLVSPPLAAAAPARLAHAAPRNASQAPPLPRSRQANCRPCPRLSNTPGRDNRCGHGDASVVSLGPSPFTGPGGCGPAWEAAAPARTAAFGTAHASEVRYEREPRTCTVRYLQHRARYSAGHRTQPPSEDLSWQDSRFRTASSVPDLLQIWDRLLKLQGQLGAKHPEKCCSWLTVAHCRRVSVTVLQQLSAEVVKDTAEALHPELGDP